MQIRKDVFVEVLDLSGDPWYQVIRPLYYDNIDGVILVFDCTNPLSFKSLRRWIQDFMTGGQEVSNRPSLFELDPNILSPLPDDIGDIPMLVIGNKLNAKTKLDSFSPGKIYGLETLFVVSISGESITHSLVGRLVRETQTMGPGSHLALDRWCRGQETRTRSS